MAVRTGSFLVVSAVDVAVAVDFGVVFSGGKTQTITIVAKPRVEKWETWVWFSTFPSGAKPGCGNVEIPRLLRDFQETVERVGKLLFAFPLFPPARHFHSPCPGTSKRSRQLRRFDLAAAQQLRLDGTHLPSTVRVAHLQRRLVPL